MSTGGKPEKQKKSKQAGPPRTPPAPDSDATMPLDKHWQKKAKLAASESDTKPLEPPTKPLLGKSEAQTKILQPTAPRPRILDPEEADTRPLTDEEIADEYATKELTWIGEDGDGEDIPEGVNIGRVWEAGEELEGLYRIERVIAQGGMGIVYKAHDLAANRPIVIKSPLASLARSRERKFAFVREAEEWVRIGVHPNIVRAYTVHEIDYLPRIVAEYIEGETLSKRLSRGLPSLAEALTLALQICYGMAFAHDRGLAHRDLKPLNILIDTEGVAKITDFGLVKRQEPGTEQISSAGLARARGKPLETSLTGTPEYTAPEQWDGKGGKAADLYAFGVLLYELFCGRRPFHFDDLDEDAQLDAFENAHRTEAPPSPLTIRPDLPPKIAQCIDACLRKDPSRRPAGFREIAEDFSAYYRKRFQQEPPGEPAREELTEAVRADQAQAYLRLAVGCEFRGDYDKGLQLCADAERIFTQQQNEKGRSACLRVRGRLLGVRGEITESLDCLEESLRIDEAHNDTISIIETLALVGGGHRKRSDFEPAMRAYVRGLELSQKAGYKHGTGMHLEAIGGVHMHRAEFDQSLMILRDALAIREELNEIHGIARCLLSIGLCYLRMNKPDEGLDALQRCLPIARTLGDVSSICACYLNMSALYRFRGQIDQSIDNLQKCLRIAEPAGMKSFMSYCYNNLGYALMSVGNMDDALPAIRKSLALKEEMGDMSGVCTSLLNLGTADYLIGRFADAGRAFERVTSIADTRGLTSEALFAHVDLVGVASVLGRFEDAEKHIEIAGKLADKMGNAHRKAIHLIYKSRYLIVSGRESEYRSAAEAILALIEDIGAGDVEMDAYNIAATLFILLGESDSAKPLLARARERSHDMQSVLQKHTMELSRALLKATDGVVDDAQLSVMLDLGNSLKSPLMNGEAQFLLGTVLLRNGFAARARDHFAAALELLEPLGHIWATRAAEILATIE